MAVVAMLAGGFLGTLVWALKRIVSHLSGGARADAAHDPSEVLEEGAHVVGGVVELDEDVPFTARVEIEQVGTQRSDSHRSTTSEWRESKRDTGPVERLHLSAEKLGRRHRRRAARLTKILFFAWLPTSAVACFLLMSFFLRTVGGTHLGSFHAPRDASQLRHSPDGD